VIDGVPAGVCEQCGEKYLLHEVVVKLEQLMATPPTR
jgi:predicted RNase H-like HicB family nuclease